jgi:circadian clock protein KaiC
MAEEEMSASSVRKAATGIAGLDAITGGGLPRGRTTLVQGGPGCGKTVLALQTLVNGVRRYGEPGIFVTFEESPERIIANAETFGWDVMALTPDSLFMLDAQPDPNLIVSGSFDISGMLAAISARAAATGARRVVFDALDVILTLLDEEAARREVHRLHDWLIASGMTAVITHRVAPASLQQVMTQRLDMLQFMVDCVVTLDHTINAGISHRYIRVVKYRGSGFDEDEAPMVIGDAGIEIGSSTIDYDTSIDAPMERVSSGIERLDAMLDGGYHRGASVLITGAPGTAKTTLCGTFVEAACRRGESTLYVSFDSRSGELIRNLASVKIDLASHVESGRLHIMGIRAVTGNADIHYMHIRQIAEKRAVRCMVIDPISAFLKAGAHQAARSVVERLIDWAKRREITIVCASLLDHDHPEREGTPLQISTIADSWIHLNYLVHAGERNRGLSIIKARGTSHSNQVRELILSDAGVTLTDVYAAGGEVLMGTLRWERERAERLDREAAHLAERYRQEQLAVEAAQIEMRLQLLQRELEIKRAEQASLHSSAGRRADEQVKSDVALRELRRADKPSSSTQEAADE